MLSRIKKYAEKYGAIAGFVLIYSLPFLVVWYFAQNIVSKGTQGKTGKRYYPHAGTQGININLLGDGTNAGSLYNHTDIKLLKAGGG